MLLSRDLSTNGRLVVRGPDRARFLHSMVTNDVEALRPGAGCRAAMLSVKGRLHGELVLYCDEESFLLEMDPALRAPLREVLEKHIVMDDVEIEDLTDGTRELALYGDEARAALATALGAEVPALPPYHHALVGGVRVAAAPELAMPGYHVFGVPSVAGASPLDDQTFEVLRVEAGRPRWGVDVDSDRLVLEANLDDAISLQKGCYLGQEVVARATARGHVNRRLLGLLLDGEKPVGRGARLSAAAREDAGMVTSSVVSPRFGAIALAYVHRTVAAPGTEVVVHDAAGERRARVTTLPFTASVSGT
jgi:folate-binding protein YgfZ